jgi:hypothetical protein
METNRGVRATVQTERAPADIPINSVVDVVPFDQFAVRYVDAEGNFRTTIVVRFNGEYYEAPGAESWAKSCKPLNEWMSKVLKARDQAKGAVPKTDNVDIMGG